MEKITVIVSNLVNSVQVIVDVLINLAFQPVFALITIIQSLIEIWSPEEKEETEEQHSVNLYQSANEGKCGAEDDYDEDISCDPYSKQIGYKINRN